MTQPVLAAFYSLTPGLGPMELLIVGAIFLLLFDPFRDKSNRR